MDPLAPLIDALHREGRLRVWSLVITIFGDLVQHRGGVVSTARLGALTRRVGIEAGTLRTALSRLGRDGWVESERQGRTSLYRLSAQGLARFAPATDLIYAPPRHAPITAWSLSVTLGDTGPQIGLVPQGEGPGAADCVVVGTLETLSEAYRMHLMGDAQAAALAALAADIDTLHAVQIEAPLDAAAARMLLIHRWRRLVLRHPEPVPELLPDGAPLPDPRRSVADMYRHLSPQTEAWLDADSDGLRPMPDADVGFARRFANRLGS